MSLGGTESQAIAVALTASGDLNREVDSAKAQFVVAPIRLPNPGQTSRPLQLWECVVVSMSESGFDAVLQDLTTPTRARERTSFEFDEIEPDDRHLVTEGAVFYWSIGYEITRTRSRKLVSTIRFRRLPAWTKNEIEAVRHKADEMGRLLGVSGSRDTTSRS